YRKSFEHPTAITPGEVTEFKYSLHGQSYKFQKGHKIMVQVQSTWFPIIDRNPQTFVPNIFEAKDSDYRAATIKVFRSPQQSSHLGRPVVSEVRPVPYRPWITTVTTPAPTTRETTEAKSTRRHRLAFRVLAVLMALAGLSHLADVVPTALGRGSELPAIVA